MDIRTSPSLVAPISAQSFSSELSQFDNRSVAERRIEAGEPTPRNLVNSTLDILDIRDRDVFESIFAQDLNNNNQFARQSAVLSEAERAQDLRLANGGAIDFFV